MYGTETTALSRLYCTLLRSLQTQQDGIKFQLAKVTSSLSHRCFEEENMLHCFNEDQNFNPLLLLLKTFVLYFCITIHTSFASQLIVDWEIMAWPINLSMRH